MRASPSAGGVAQTPAGDLAAALDPVIFAGAVGVEPDAWQADVLRAPDRRILLNCSRQAGKSTVGAVSALHQATYRPGSLVLLVSPSLRQSTELFRVVARLQAWLDPAGLTVEGESGHRLELANGSRIVSLPGSEQTIRGYSGADLLILDEAARIEDALYHAVTPMLATTNGRLLALSTPFGKRGWWSDAWHGALPWKRVKMTAPECPRISPVFLAEQRESMGAFWFQQEFLCEFVDASSSAFRSVDIERALAEEVEQWTV